MAAESDQKCMGSKTILVLHFVPEKASEGDFSYLFNDRAWRQMRLDGEANTLYWSKWPRFFEDKKQLDVWVH